MRNKSVTIDFYINKLGFHQLGSEDYDEYLIVYKDNIQIHFFKFSNLDPEQNYGQVYIRTDNIDELFQYVLGRKINIYPSEVIQLKPWGQKEFSILDPDNNLITFGQNN